MFAANAVCDPETAQTTVTWQVNNNGAAPVEIVDLTESVTLEPSVVPANSMALATEVIDGPETDQQVTSTVTIDLGGGGSTELSDDIVAPACEGPEAPADLSFTLTKTASVAEAIVGDTVEYTYCGQNTSTIPLEVLRVVDDRLGVVIEEPSAETVVQPGESVCNTDLGLPASYVVRATDAGSFIDNNAVVTVRTQETEPREFQATASASVGVRDVADSVAPCLMLDVKRELSADEQLPTWTYNAPAGTLITGYCYKYSTTVVGPSASRPACPLGHDVVGWFRRHRPLHDRSDLRERHRGHFRGAGVSS